MILLTEALFCQSQKLPSFLSGQICHFIHLGTRQNNLYYFLPASIQGSSKARGSVFVLFMAAEEKQNVQKKNPS